MVLTPDLVAFVRPLYQDLDGRSRWTDVVRVSTLARMLHHPGRDEERQMEILLLFHELGPWLGRLGNLSRTVLGAAGAIGEGELRRAAESLKRLDRPVSAIERALAGAILIDQAGTLGLMERLARVRREGCSPLELVRDVAASSPEIPDWLSEPGRAMLEHRHTERRVFCQRILTEEGLEDLLALTS